MITITIDDSGNMTLHGEFSGSTASDMFGYNRWHGATLPYKNVFDPMNSKQKNGSDTGRFPDAWSTDPMVNPPHRPNIFDVKPGWICNGNGVTNAVVCFVGDASNPIITISYTPIMVSGGGGFQNDGYYTFRQANY